MDLEKLSSEEMSGEELEGFTFTRSTDVSPYIAIGVDRSTITALEGSTILEEMSVLPSRYFQVIKGEVVFQNNRLILKSCTVLCNKATADNIETPAVSNAAKKEFPSLIDQISIARTVKCQVEIGGDVLTSTFHETVLAKEVLKIIPPQTLVSKHDQASIKLTFQGDFITVNTGGYIVEDGTLKAGNMKVTSGQIEFIGNQIHFLECTSHCSPKMFLALNGKSTNGCAILNSEFALKELIISNNVSCRKISPGSF